MRKSTTSGKATTKAKGAVTTVTEYIARAPKWAQPLLRELRRVIRKAAPEARESISYRMPYYSQNGRLAYFAAFTSHCSFFWLSAQDRKTYAKELASQTVVGSTLRIPRGGKVPAALIQKIVRNRVRENMAKKGRRS